MSPRRGALIPSDCPNERTLTMTKKITNTTREVAERPEIALMEMMFSGDSSAAIKLTEARGQRELVNAAVLPTDGLVPHAIWEAMGIKIGDPVAGDEMFTNVTLPAGWAKRPTDHALWSDLIDSKRRKRASIFYKAAFYDRSASVIPTVRFEVSRDVDRKDYREVVQYRVFDSGSVVFSGGALPIPRINGKPVWKATARLQKQAMDECKTWLDDHGYQDFENPTAYWE
jgi:hypothetical protein